MEQVVLAKIGGLHLLGKHSQDRWKKKCLVRGLYEFSAEILVMVVRVLSCVNFFLFSPLPCTWKENIMDLLHVFL